MRALKDDFDARWQYHPTFQDRTRRVLVVIASLTLVVIAVAAWVGSTPECRADWVTADADVPADVDRASIEACLNSR